MPTRSDRILLGIVLISIFMGGMFTGMLVCDIGRATERGFWDSMDADVGTYQNPLTPMPEYETLEVKPKYQYRKPC